MFKAAKRSPGTRLTNTPTERLDVGEGKENRPLPLRMAPRVLDLGCGTGVWMNDMAKEYPRAQFVGIDIHNMSHNSHNDNITVYAPFDYESPWAIGEKSWDLIHLQMALGSVSDWSGLYRKIIKHLVPGTGWFESVELDFEPRCDDGSLKPGKLTEWWEIYLKHFYQTINRRIHYDPNTGDLLKAAGFKDIHHAVYKIPLNPWSNDRSEHRAAIWWGQVMSRGTDRDGGYGMEALSLAPLCGYNGWKVDHVERLCEDALTQAAHPDCHVYNNLHVWWARAPESTGF
ncbi:hypothetical protein A1O1_00845 [Capronia coronata CBS 617.96]|uniref:Velvet complex subunit laeA n=1 Tax=Capronia coronata CBS 617.96 TaxID=1182541 RepID=W9Z2B4_9EURO|nr:uncharacterized protein A1O1_00845 [Capronia coronata CBS 617.96]EXJ95721.1 hypothetical protein A1O1_00845 [Capronia coronata CBS 617.96]